MEIYVRFPPLRTAGFRPVSARREVVDQRHAGARRENFPDFRIRRRYLHFPPLLLHGQQRQMIAIIAPSRSVISPLGAVASFFRSLTAAV